jgi:hypothetical protein
MVAMALALRLVRNEIIIIIIINGEPSLGAVADTARN